jgi:hypothetical protein
MVETIVVDNCASEEIIPNLRVVPFQEWGSKTARRMGVDSTSKDG